MKNKNVVIYIVGILTGLVFIPIIKESLNVILTWIEYLKIKPSELIAKGNKELIKLQGENEDVDTCTIGFQYTPEINEDYEEE